MTSSYEHGHLPTDPRSTELDGEVVILDQPADLADELDLYRNHKLEQLAEAQGDEGARDLQAAIETHDASVRDDVLIPSEVMGALQDAAIDEDKYRSKGYKQGRINFLVGRELIPHLLRLQNQGIDTSHAILSDQPKPASVIQLPVRHNDTPERERDFRERQFKD